MLFNELIEQQGLESVVSKTNISSINLNFLLNEDFENLNRVKALGFLLIFEREYKDIDVNDLRQKIKLYYEENKPSDDKVVMVAKGSTTGGGGFSFFKLFIISGVIGGGYYLYTHGQLDSIIQKIVEKKNFFDDNKALENNVSTEDAKKVVVGKSEDENEPESVRIKTPIAPKVEVINLNSEESNESNDSTMNTESMQGAQSQIQSVISTPTVTETNQSIEEVVQEVSEAFLAKEANSSNAQEDENEKTEEMVATPITTISINPTRGMLWYGFINLETKKRREFMKKVSTPFEINNGKWLLVTGHGYVDVVSDAKTVEVSDNKKHYFLIDSRDIKEINKKEFRSLNGNRGW